jgi:CTP:molybdopterin cytidylyltransferase MocA
MIALVVLAAGASSRMGAAGPKALVRGPDGRSFLERVSQSARAGGAGQVVVVLGPPHGAEIRRALPPGSSSAWNPLPDRGMLSSVQAGIAALPAAATAALIWPVDVPLVEPETVRAILAAHPGKIVIPCVRDPKGKLRGGHPLRIPRARFAELAALDPELGLKALIEARPDEVERLEVADRGILVDVDTPDELGRLFKSR